MEQFRHNELQNKPDHLERKPLVLSLSEKDIPEIIGLENKSWIPGLQATEESIQDRIRKNHVILGIRDGERLVAKICFSCSSFWIDQPEKFPDNFEDFSHQPIVESPNALFVYNLDVDPDYRGKIYAPTLIKAVVEEAIKLGLKYIVADGRPSSYNGSGEFGQDKVKQSLDFKQSIDRYLNGGSFPTDAEFMKDPTLALYRRLTGCKFYSVLPNFIPGDEPAGGIRVILVKEVNEMS